MWTNISRFPLPLGFFNPVDRPSRWASLLDWIVVSCHVEDCVCPENNT